MTRLGRGHLVCKAVQSEFLRAESDASYGKAYLRKAQAEMELQMFEEAVRTYTKAQEVDPQMAGIQDMLSTAKRKLKKSKRIDYYKCGACLLISFFIHSC